MSTAVPVAASVSAPSRASRRSSARRALTPALSPALVAHDINNLLFVIGGQAELLELGLLRGVSLAHELGEIRRNCERAMELTEALVAAPDDAVEPAVEFTLDVHDHLCHLQPLLRRAAGSHHLTIDAPTHARLALPTSDFDRIVVNLVKNARESIRGIGEIQVRTVATDCTIALQVRDTGVGMDEATASRLNEPYFTTKQASGGRRRGLGLASVVAVAESTGGVVRVSSQLGVGTTVTVEWPRASV